MILWLMVFIRMGMVLKMLKVDSVAGSNGYGMSIVFHVPDRVIRFNISNEFWNLKIEDMLKNMFLVMDSDQVMLV